MLELKEVSIDPAQLKALSSDMRIEILKLLSSRKYTVSEIAKKLNCSKSTAHEHIKKLEAVGLIERVENGYAPKWVYYKLTAKGTMLFDRSRRVVLVLAGLFIVLAFTQLAFLLLQSFTPSKLMEKAMPSEVPLIEKTIVPTIAPSTENMRQEAAYASEELQKQAELIKIALLCGVLFCSLLAMTLAIYALKKRQKLIIRGPKP